MTLCYSQFISVYLSPLGVSLGVLFYFVDFSNMYVKYPQSMSLYDVFVYEKDYPEEINIHAGIIKRIKMSCIISEGSVPAI